MQEPSKRLDPRVRAAWWVVAAGVAAIAATAAFVGALATETPLAAAVALAIWIVVVAAALPHLMYRRWRYEVRERDVYLAKGFLFSRHTLIPFDRIQYVENRTGPVDRIFGLTKVVIYTAAGESGTIPGLDTAEAEAIREELSKVAGSTP